MKAIKIIFRFTKSLFLLFFIFIFIYILATVTLSKITVNKQSTRSEKKLFIFIKTNGVHTDVVVPMKNSIKDWSKQIKINTTEANDTSANFLAFGWGNKAFYLDTPEWSDLKFSTAFNAAFGIGDAAMYTTFYKSINESTNCIKISITEDDYRQLITYIEGSLKRDEFNNPICIKASSYGKSDSFYEANGKYNLFHTCNSWTNSALKKSNQKAAFWTVTDGGIFCHYQ